VTSIYEDALNQTSSAKLTSFSFKAEQISFYLSLKLIALLVAIILMLIVLAFVIFCIFKYRKALPSSNNLNENIPQKKNIFKKIWERRLKKKIDDRVYGKFVHKTDSEISHISNTNSIIMLNEISNKTTIC
jgi:anionic cell wall polymer biosynthesis LytR-Cps2A-Psr (LCP) family protein